MKYLDVSQEVEELKSTSNGAKEKALAGAALAGKGIVNLGKFLIKEGPPALERMSTEMKRQVEAEKLRRGD